MRPIDADELIEHAWRDKLDSRELIVKMIKTAPTIDSDNKPISYKDCACAMMKMWMENVLTDGEYNRIMDKLNAKHREGKI